MKEYRTRQREGLIDFLRQNRDCQLSVEEIAQCTPGISLSAVYRNINQLVAEGAVRRFQKEGSRKFLYQYVGEGECTDCLHLKCEKCGSILHLDSESAAVLENVLQKNSCFMLDRSKSILFGSCETCK